MLRVAIGRWQAKLLFCSVPMQLGVGLRGSLEAIIYRVKQVLLEKEDEGKMLLQIDLMNAIDEADRQAAFKEVEEHFPRF